MVVDVETTGGSPATDSLTEVAAARYRGGELLGTYQTFVRPDERIPPFITALTGISDAMVADAPRVGEMLPSFLEFVGRSVLVGHNLRFDLSFLDHALVATGRPRLDNATVDTLALARRLVRDVVPDCKLGTLAASLRLPHQPSHRALTDVLATGDLLHAMLERAGSFGILELEELLDLPRLVGHPQAGKLRLTVRLPHRPGVYWFSDAAGHVLYVGKATDLHTRVRSYFTSDERRKVGRLLRQLHTVHHRVCTGPLRAAVMEGRLIRAWAPPFNQQGKGRRRGSAAVSRSAQTDASGPRPARRRRGRRRDWSPDNWPVIRPSCSSRWPGASASWPASSATRRPRRCGTRPSGSGACSSGTARVESLRTAGRLVLAVDGEGVVELDGGRLVEPATLPDPGAVGPVGVGDGDEAERAIVAQWLRVQRRRGTRARGRVDPGSSLTGPADPDAGRAVRWAGPGRSRAGARPAVGSVA